MKVISKIFIINLFFKIFECQDSISEQFLQFANQNISVNNDIIDKNIYKLFDFPKVVYTIISNILRNMTSTSYNTNDKNLLECLKNIDFNYISNYSFNKNTPNTDDLKKLYEGSSKGFTDLGSYYNCYEETNKNFYTVFPLLNHMQKLDIAKFNESSWFNHKWLFGFCIVDNLCDENSLKKILIAINQEFRENNITIVDDYYDNETHFDIINNLALSKEITEFSLKNFTRLIPLFLIVIQILFIIFKNIPAKLFRCCIKRKYVRENNNDPKKIGYLLNKAFFTKKIDMKIRECFSFSDNFDELFNTKKNNEYFREEDLTYIKGIKAFGIIFLVFGTTFQCVFNYPICITENEKRIEFIKSISSLILINLWRFSPGFLLSASGYSLSYKFLNFLDKKLANIPQENIEDNKNDEKEKSISEEKYDTLENKEKSNNSITDEKDNTQSKNNAAQYYSSIISDSSSKEKDESKEDELKSKSYLENSLGIKFYQNDIAKKQLNSMFKNQKLNDLVVLSKIPTKKIPISYFFNFIFRQFHKIFFLNIAIHYCKNTLAIAFSFSNKGAPLINYLYKRIIDKLDIGFGNFFFYRNFSELIFKKEEHNDYDKGKTISLLKVCSIIICEFNFYIIGTILIFFCYKKKLPLDYIIILLIFVFILFKIIYNCLLENNNPGMIYFDSMYQNFFYNPICNFNYYLIGMLFGIVNYVVQNDVLKNESFIKERPMLDIPIFISKACNYKKIRNLIHYILSLFVLIICSLIYPLIFLVDFENIIKKDKPSKFFKIISSIDVEFFLYLFHFFMISNYITGRNLFFQVLNSNVWLQISKLYFWIVLLTPILCYFVIYQTETQLSLKGFFILIYGAICGTNIYIISVLFFVILELPYKKLIKLYFNICSKINNEEEYNEEELNNEEKYPLQKDPHITELSEKILEKENNEEEDEENDEN